MRTARNRATDRIRRDRALATKFGMLVAGDRAEVPMNTTTFPDERLELIFTCCHPALAVEAQVALIVDGKDATEFRGNESIFVATPEVLARYGINPSEIDPGTDILTSRSDLAGFELIPGRHSDWHPKIQRVDLPSYSPEPTALITPHALESLGLTALPVGWLIQTPQPLTPAQIDKARPLAVAASIKTGALQASLSQLRTDATSAGVLVALGVLAMTVGLIRSETARDLRTLAATGASSMTRRSLTSATAGALALLGALLGTAGAYLALLAWCRSQLHLLSPSPSSTSLSSSSAYPWPRPPPGGCWPDGNRPRSPASPPNDRPRHPGWSGGTPRTK
jgi:hypothetical protein